MGFEQPLLGGKPRSKEEKVEDIEQARVGAQAEKPGRDLAREEGAKEGISKKEKTVIDQLAEKHGEEAMQEYAAEKEKNPVERLRGRIDKIAAEMREKGLEPDAAIVEKIKGRFDRYAEAVREEKEQLEGESNTRVSVQELANKVGREIPITYRIGEKGGIIYGPENFTLRRFGDTGYAKENKGEYLETLKKQSGISVETEIIDFGFSRQGKTEFLRSMGVLNEKEEAIDLPTIAQGMLNKQNEARGRGGMEEVRIDPRNYSARFSTNIEGVAFSVGEREESYDEGSNKPRKDESWTGLKFDDNVIETILAEE